MESLQEREKQLAELGSQLAQQKRDLDEREKKITGQSKPLILPRSPP